MNITLPIYLKEKSLFSALSHNTKNRIVLSILMLLTFYHSTSAVEVILGKENDIHTIHINQLNENNLSTNSSSKNTKIKNTLTSHPVKLPAFIEELIKIAPIIFIDANSTSNISETPSTMDRVLQPNPLGGISLEGKGSKEVIALSDGTVNLQVYLSTFNPASIEVHLYDTDGSETWFKGQPLLVWKRADSHTNDPLSFKGQIDNKSMYLAKAGDYSPAQDLSYKFDIEKGQKIKIVTGGNALEASFIKVKGNCF